MYEGDIPNAERRAAALSLDRDLLRELLGQEELRDLIDPTALARVEDELQCLSDLARAANRDGLHDVLRRVGDLTVAEAQARCLDGVDAGSMLTALAGERRATRVRIAGEERWIDAADAGLYRDALGACLRGAAGRVPRGHSRRAPAALHRYAMTHGPFTTDEVRARYGVDAGAVLRELERDGGSCKASCARGDRRASGVTPRCCAVYAAPRWRCCARRSSRPSRAHSRASCPVAGRRPPSRVRRRGRPAARDARAVAGPRAAPEVWESDVLPRRVGAYSPSWIDQLCASGELVWLGAGALGRNSGRVALYFREDAATRPPAGVQRRAARRARPRGDPGEAGNPAVNLQLPLRFTPGGVAAELGLEEAYRFR